MFLSYQKLSYAMYVVGTMFIVFSFVMRYLPNWFMLTDDTQSWWMNSFLCFGINIFSSVILLNLYDMLQTRDKTSKRKIFFCAIKNTLIHQVTMLSIIYKATATPDQVFQENKSVTDFLCIDEYYETISNLDSNRNAPILPTTTWIRYIVNEDERFARELTEYYGKYIYFLDVYTISLINEITNNTMRSFFRQVPTILSLNPDFNIAAIFSEQIFKRYVKEIADLVNVYNDVCPDEKIIIESSQLWATNVAPHVGESRIV